MRSYFVCATPRSGSSLLTGLLASTLVAGRPEEYFWRDHEPGWRHRWKTRTDAEYVRAVAERSATANGVAGVKLMWGHLDEFLAKLPEGRSDLERIAAAFPDPRFVFVRREDVVAQAISHVRALQSGIWYAEHQPDAQPELIRFDAAEIAAMRDATDAWNAGWRSWFEQEGIAAFDVVYEELEREPKAWTRRVLAFLEIKDQPAALQPSTAVQRDATNADWAARFRALGC